MEADESCSLLSWRISYSALMLNYGWVKCNILEHPNPGLGTVEDLSSSIGYTTTPETQTVRPDCDVDLDGLGDLDHFGSGSGYQ